MHWLMSMILGAEPIPVTPIPGWEEFFKTMAANGGVAGVLLYLGLKFIPPMVRGQNNICSSVERLTRAIVLLLDRDERPIPDEVRNFLEETNRPMKSDSD